MPPRTKIAGYIMSKTIKIILADDHSLLRAGLKSFLEEQSSPKIKIIAEASSGKEALQKIIKYSPDLLILDLSMPNMGGLETALELKKNKSVLNILILTQ
jgi:DNA-binding NarL/FixJ family response regulator